MRACRLRVAFDLFNGPLASEERESAEESESERAGFGDGGDEIAANFSAAICRSVDIEVGQAVEESLLLGACEGDRGGDQAVCGAVVGDAEGLKDSDMLS